MASELVPNDLPSWLNYIERLHPKSIAMGLERIFLVIGRLKLQQNFKIITVAGTNGKGSTCAMLAEIYTQAGYAVGSYASPHLLRYNERVRVNGKEVEDAELCAAFSVVESARQGKCPADVIELTYFEVGTLAAIWHFTQVGIDVAILEVGLGGRLDAVNAFEPNCAIVTSVDLDHQEFLGDTREAIGFEKAGVYRPSLPAICGDSQPPQSLIDHAKQIYADFKCITQDFGFALTDTKWQYQLHDQVIYTLPLPALQGKYQLANAACAITAVESLQASLPVDEGAIASAMEKVFLAGRFQVVSQSPWVILDVAHNTHAAKALAENLAALKKQHQIDHPVMKHQATTSAVFAMLADKDIKGVINAIKHEIDVWYVAGIDHARAALASDLAVMIHEVAADAVVKIFDTPADAYQQICIDRESCIDVNENDKIVVFGSFYTVSNVMQYLEERKIT